MIVLRLYEYSLPLKRPFPVGQIQLEVRRGFLLQACDEHTSGWGEASPLPGFSLESSQDILDQFRRLLADGIEDNGETDWRILLEKEKIKAVSAPALRFGVESALIDLCAARQGLTPTALWGGSRTLRNNGLAFGDSADALVVQAARLAEEGYRVIKIKVGRLKLAEELTAIREIAGRFPLRLRLDANRMFTLDKALRFAHIVADLPIEYIEEPVADPHDLSEFCRSAPVAAALDESLLFPETAELPVAAWILKPGVHGGISDLITRIAHARARNILPVISSPLLSAVGLRMAATIAAAFCPDEAMGLDTASLFARDFWQSPLAVKGGVLQLPEIEKSLHINVSELTCTDAGR